MLGIVGEVFGAAAVGAIADVRFFDASSRDKATLGHLVRRAVGTRRRRQSRDSDLLVCRS